MPEISEQCRRDLQQCKPEEIVQIVVNETVTITNNVRKDVEKSLADMIVWGVLLFIGIELGILFELYIIPLNPVTGFWGIIITLIVLVGFLIAFTVFRAIYRRVVNGK